MTDFLMRIPPETKRVERLDRLRAYYLTYLVEDPIDGTSLDCSLLDIFDTMEEHYKKQDDSPVMFAALENIFSSHELDTASI